MQSSEVRRDLGGAVVKNLPASIGDARDLDSIPGSGRSAGEGIQWRMSSKHQHYRNQLTKMDWNG